MATSSTNAETIGVQADHDAEAQPLAEQQVRPANRSGQHRLRNAGLDVGRECGRREERRGHRKHEAEHERDEDHGLGQAEREAELTDLALAREGHEALEAPAGDGDDDDREPDERPEQASPGRLQDGDLHDRDHGRGVSRAGLRSGRVGRWPAPVPSGLARRAAASRATRSKNRSSSVSRCCSTA